MNRLASSLALAAIGLYSRHLSPLKGYRCAYGVAHGTSTCSGQGLRIFRRAGLIKGVKLLSRQFDACTLAAEQLRNSRTHLCRIGEDREIQEAQGSYLRYRRQNAGYARSQAGVVDCDCGGAAPDCGSPDCVGGKGCMPDCFPDCPDCNPLATMCRVSSICCDGSNLCDTSDKKSFKRRVAAARERQAQTQKSRKERRRKRKDDAEKTDDSPKFGSDDDNRGTVRHGHDGHSGGDGGNDSGSSGDGDD